MDWVECPDVMQPTPDPQHRTREAREATARPVRTFALCLVASVVASALPLPWSVGAIVFLVAAGVAGIVALRAVTTSGGRPGVVVLVSCLLALCALMLLGELARLALWQVYWDLQECLRGAITESARAACDAEFRSRVVSGLLRTTR